MLRLCNVGYLGSEARHIPSLLLSMTALWYIKITTEGGAWSGVHTIMSWVSKAIIVAVGLEGMSPQTWREMQSQ